MKKVEEWRETIFTEHEVKSYIQKDHQRKFNSYRKEGLTYEKLQFFM